MVWDVCGAAWKDQVKKLLVPGAPIVPWSGWERWDERDLRGSTFAAAHPPHAAVNCTVTQKHSSWRGMSHLWVKNREGRSRVFIKKKKKNGIFIVKRWASGKTCVCVCAVRRSNVGNATGKLAWREMERREARVWVGRGGKKNTHERQRERCGGGGKPPLLEDTHHVKVERGREAAVPLRGGGGRRGRGVRFPWNCSRCKKKKTKKTKTLSNPPPTLYGQHSNARTDGNNQRAPLNQRPPLFTPRSCSSTPPLSIHHAHVRNTRTQSVTARRCGSQRSCQRSPPEEREK